jgi:hypothetical protein
MGSAEDWADSLAKRVQAKREEETRKAKITAMNREIEAEGMPALWTELIVEFQKHCAVFNERLQPERVLTCFSGGSHHFEVKPDARPEIVTGDYDPHTKHITITTAHGKEIFVSSVLHEGTGKLELVSLQTRRSVTLEKIARTTIEVAAL